MADTTFAINGFSVLGGSNIRVRPKGGNENEGGLEVTGGAFVFETDDIVVFEVTDADANGGIDGGSTITGIIVYDNAADYLNDVPKFTYSGNGSIRGNNAGVGDNYLRLNLGSMSSSDAGAPTLNQMFVSAGQDLSPVAAGGTTFFDQFSDNDYNQNNTIDPTGLEEADGIFHGGATGNDIYLVLCFARGTLIETPSGPQFIETLREGDLVNTLDHGAQPIRWSGQMRMKAEGPNAPVRIETGALGNLRPLWVSQNHRMMIRGAHAELLFGQNEVLVAAKHLVNGNSIRIVEGGEVEYHHFLCDRHEIIFAECCPAETLFVGEQTLGSVPETERDEIIALFPELQRKKSLGQTTRLSLKRYEVEAMRWIA